MDYCIEPRDASKENIYELVADCEQERSQMYNHNRSLRGFAVMKLFKNLLRQGKPYIKTTANLTINILGN